MSDSREAFEKWAWSENGAEDFSRESGDDYTDEMLESMWMAWQDSRQALEGEPAMWSLSFNGGPANHFTTYPTKESAEDYISLCEIGEKESDKGRIEVVPLYTHPASADVPNEKGSNRYGLDMAYFRTLFNRELNQPLTNFRPDELARVLARAARTADAEVLNEAEFSTQTSADVLDGWKLVPVEPTETMLEEIHLVKEFTHKAMSVRYKAMLDAAPEPPIKGSPA